MGVIPMAQKSHPYQLPHSREIKPTYTQLEGHNKISVGVKHNEGVYKRPTLSMTSNNLSSGAEIFTGRNQEPYLRSTENDSKYALSQIP